LRTKLPTKEIISIFPFVNFSCICSNIPAYRVYISQFILYYKVCDSYQDFHDRGLLQTTRKLLNYGILMLSWSHHL